MDVGGDGAVVGGQAAGCQPLARQEPEAVAGRHGHLGRRQVHRRHGGCRRGLDDGRRCGDGHGGGRQRQLPPGADHAGTRQSAAVGLGAIEVELVDLAPPRAVTEVRPGQPEQRVAVADRHDRRRRRRRHDRGNRRRTVRRHHDGRRRMTTGREAVSGVSGRRPRSQRQEHEGRGDQALGDQSGAVAGRGRRQPNARRRRRGSQLAPLGELGVDLDHDGHEEPHPDQPHQQRQHPDDDGRLIAHLEARRARPRVADEREQQQRHPHDEGETGGDGPERRQLAAHGTSPAAWTPRRAVARDVDDTVLPPGSTR